MVLKAVHLYQMARRRLLIAAVGRCCRKESGMLPCAASPKTEYRHKLGNQFESEVHAVKKFCNEDYQMLRTVRGLQISPDGRRALYTVQRMNVKRDAYENYLWLLDLESGRETQLTTGGRENGAFWLDNNHVLFSTVGGGDVPVNETVFYSITVDGGEAVEYMRIPVAGAQASLLGNDRFLVRADTDLNPETERNQDKWLFFDEYPYWGDGGSYENRHRRALFLWDRAAGELRQLTAPTMQTFMTFCSDDVLTDKDGICYVGYDYDRDEAGRACICRYEWASGETKILCRDSCYVFSLAQRNGRVYYGAWAIEDGPAIASIRIKSVSLNGGDMRVDAEPQWELGTVRQRDGVTLFQRTFQAKTIMARWTDELEYEDIPTPGINPTCPISVGEDIIFTGWRSNRLPEIYRWRDGQVTQLSHQNDELYDTYSFSVPEPFCVEDGSDKVYGWVMKPVEYEPGKKYPGILNIHGGPHGCYNDAFTCEHQRWANEGYFVFFCNPRGSTTYGVDFMNVTGRLGEEDFHNVMAFTDAVLEAYPGLDPERLAITGQSYGGFMTSWAVGHTDRFKAATARMSPINWISMHGTSVERWYGDRVVAATPWTDLDALWRQSPLRYADRVTTPTLFIQHEKDQYCPLEQAQQMFVALLERGVDTRLMVNRGCGHGGRRVSQLLHDIDVMLEWFGRYLM